MLRADRVRPVPWRDFKPMRDIAAGIAWYQASTLAERAATLKGVAPDALAPEFDAERAAERLREWRSQSPFNEGSLFETRLALDGVTEEELRRLLGESAEALRARFASAPAWLEEIAEAYRPDASAPPEEGHTRPQWTARYPLLSIAEPLIRRGAERVRDAVEELRREHEAAPFNPADMVAALFQNLPVPLFTMLGRTLALELNVARLQGRLEGDTPEERFKNFFAQLRQPEKALALLEEYPVLARQLAACVDRWANVSIEFTRRLCADWASIRELLLPGEPGLVKSVQAGAGDSHRGGRSVAVVEFEDGRRLVYKPRSLKVEIRFQELLGWLNERGDHSPFRTLKILDCGEYGWTEFVSAQSCRSADELRRFYERQGGYLALLYALEATDFHYENLIAAGEHPVLIDLESLFQPRVTGLDLARAEQPGLSPMVYSVLRVGLLPQRIWFKENDSEGLDLSGMGGQSGQLSPNAVPYWEDEGTDQMRLARQRLPLPASQNRPKLDGGEVNVLAYADAFTQGFTSVYRTLLARRDELTDEGGLISRFAEDEVRSILRPSRGYALLVSEAFHPDLFRDALERERFLDRLWVGTERRPDFIRVIMAERADLEQGDIPVFTTRPGSRDLWTSRGERVAEFFEETGLSLVKSRFRHLGESDLTRQFWFINASLASLSMGEDGAAWPAYTLPATAPREMRREDLLEAARAVGDRLDSLVLRSEQGDLSWIGLALINQKHWTPLPLGMDLYNGLPGVALFLAYLGSVTGEERYTRLARETLETVRRHLALSKDGVKVVGAFDGWGGTLYTLTHLGALWRQPELIAEAEAYVELLPTLVAEDTSFDLISGAAGCIAGLRALHLYAPRERTLEVAVRCGEHLIGQRVQMERGVGWKTRMASKPLTGFSHGASGIGWALMELSALSGNERFRQVALESFDYERGYFSPEAGNWPDLRDSENTPPAGGNGNYPYLTMWCHGAPGIGLARLLALQHLSEPSLRQEAEAGLETTIEQGFGKNHSLCHGDLGNLDVLLQGSSILGDATLHRRVRSLASRVLESINEHGWLCGVPLGVESPGLMTGLAGIGYGLLRLAVPEQVPSVLSLEPPYVKTV